MKAKFISAMSVLMLFVGLLSTDVIAGADSANLAPGDDGPQLDQIIFYVS